MYNIVQNTTDKNEQKVFQFLTYYDMLVSSAWMVLICLEQDILSGTIILQIFSMPVNTGLINEN